MEPWSQIFAQTRDLLNQLRPAQRWTLTAAALLVAALLTWFAVGRSAADTEILVEGRPVPTAELFAARAALDAAGLRDYRIANGRLLAPRAEIARYTAALSSGRGTTAAAGGASGRDGRQNGASYGLSDLLLSQQERHARADESRARELEDEIRRNEEIASVRLFVDRSRGGWPRAPRMTASLIVVTRNKSTLPDELVSELRSLVAHAYSGLLPENVVVSCPQRHASTTAREPAAAPAAAVAAPVSPKLDQAGPDGWSQHVAALGSRFVNLPAAIRPAPATIAWSAPVCLAFVCSVIMWRLRAPFARRAAHAARVSGAKAPLAAKPGATPVGPTASSEASGDATAAASVPQSEVTISRRPVAESLVRDSLQQAGPERIAQLAIHENPQAAAVIFAQLPEALAAAALARLPETMQFEVVRRIATLGDVDPELAEEVARTLAARLSAADERPLRSQSGVAAAARLLNAAGPGAHQALLERLAGEHAELAGLVRQKMFSFDELRQLDDADTGALLEEVSPGTWVLALKGASSEVRTKILKLLPRSSAETVQEELDELGPVRVGDVEAAQRQVLTALGRLSREGRIAPRPSLRFAE